MRIDHDQIDHDAMHETRLERDSHREPRHPFLRSAADVVAARVRARAAYRTELLNNPSYRTSDPWSAFVFLWTVIGNAEQLDAMIAAISTGRAG